MTRSNDELDGFLAEAGAGADPAVLDALSDAIASAIEPVPPGPAVRERVLAGATREGRFHRFAPRAAELLGIEVDAAAALLDDLHDDDGRWRMLAPQVEMRPVPVGSERKQAGWMASILRMSPGAVLAEHRHFGRERTLVLQGNCVDRPDGGVRRAGDELHKTPGSSHAVEVLDGPDLVFLAVVEHGFEMGGQTFGRNPG